MREIIMGYQGEMSLKGLNRNQFESAMMKILRYRLKTVGKFKVYCTQSTFYMEPEEEDIDMDLAFDRVRTVFGLAALSRAVVCEKDFDTICQTAEDYLGDSLHGIKTFDQKRIDEAMVDAASIVCKSDCVLSYIFTQMIGGNEKILKKADSIVYEDSMGISAWVDGKRVLIGNRELMMNHNIEPLLLKPLQLICPGISKVDILSSYKSKRIKPHVSLRSDLVIQLAHRSAAQIPRIFIFCIGITDLFINLLKIFIRNNCFASKDKLSFKRYG